MKLLVEELKSMSDQIAEVDFLAILEQAMCSRFQGTLHSYDNMHADDFSDIMNWLNSLTH